MIDGVGSSTTRTSDGDELRTGTDPLDPSSDFTGTLAPATGGTRTITWPSKPGARYRLETSTTLTAPWDELDEDVPAHASDPTTSYTLPISADPARFYRVTLKDQ